MGELGLAFVKLTKFETEEALYDSQRVRAADMKMVGNCCCESQQIVSRVKCTDSKTFGNRFELFKKKIYFIL